MSTGQNVWSVSEVNEAVRTLLEDSLMPLWVCGEVGNLTLHRSGHVYLTLKDEKSQIKAVFFGGVELCRKLNITAGAKVEAFGKLSVYMQRGEYQLNIKTLRPLGIGDLQAQFEELKNRLASEGLFDPDRKKPIPFLPTRIGVVTSPEGAALQDFLKISLNRFPQLHIKICPAAVQGKGAEKEIARGIARFNAEKDVDVIVVTRGGGSLEDLWPFNEEITARAIAASTIPVVSAVGHEIDFTIADFAADLRAPTPSGAAELLIPERTVLEGELSSLATRLKTAVSLAGERAENALNALLHSDVLRRPLYFVMEKSQCVDMYLRDMESALKNDLTSKEQTLAALEEKLHAVGPESVLGRGYAILLGPDKKTPLTDPGQVPSGMDVTARLAKGDLSLTVK